MSINISRHIRRQVTASVAGLVALASMPLMVFATTSNDGTLETRGFVENATFYRDDVGLSKARNALQYEFSKRLSTSDRFTDVSINGTFRGTYDAVYDLNDDQFGDKSGRSVSFPAPGNPTFFDTLVRQSGGPGAPFAPTTNPAFAGIFGPAAAGADGAIPLPGVPMGTINSPNNPNDGLRLVGENTHNFNKGGVMLAFPTRPCNVDDRGCLDDYLDFDESELEYPEFNDKADFIRELYLDATLPFDSGRELGFRIGRQQVVWGRTDLFRVLDVINPVDFSRHNIFDELEEIRYGMGIFNAEYRMGATEKFDDLNFQFLWKFEEFRPHNLGQGGQPYVILGAGDFFRAMGNCWQNGCTVGNFPATGLAVDFPKHSLGIRDVDVPDNLDEVGFRLEGLFKGVGFSLNAARYYSQLPSLRGGVKADNPFTPAIESQFFPYNLAFDIAFPTVYLLGASADLYSEKIKSAFRLELAFTTGEEFSNTLEERLFSESDVVRWVVGWDRPTFIPFISKKRAVLISAQLFGQHLLDHELQNVNPQGLPTVGSVGIPDWENNYIATLLLQANFKNDRLTPQLLTAYDFKADSGAFAPSITWKPNNKWVFNLGLNLKFGDGAKAFDDNRSANPFPPFTCAPPVVAAAPSACGSAFGSLGVGGFEPLGRFRAGPFGNAINEDELQFTVRYQF